MSKRILYTSEASGTLWNVCSWDPSNGSSLTTYKGAVSRANSLCLLGGDYLLSAVDNKPLIHVWSLAKKEQIHMRMVCSGQVTSLAVSPDGNYCVGTLSEKIHVWQTSTGNLVGLAQGHYQKINCVKFTDDGSYFVTGADDNLVNVWSISRILLENKEQEGDVAGCEALHTWTAHSLAITDIHVGCGGPAARVYTASIDRTVKIWELSSGSLLCNLNFEYAVSALTVDSAETRLFAGTSSGDLFKVDLFESPVRAERHIDPSTETSHLHVFSGHSKQVSCLSVSFDGTMVVSGSLDNTVKIWDVLSRQCVRTLVHKGPVTNVLMVPNRANIEAKPTHHISQFKRTLHDSSAIEGRDTIHIRIRKRKTVHAGSSSIQDVVNNQVHQSQEEDSDTKESLEENIKKLKSVNKKLYEFSLHEIINKPKT